MSFKVVEHILASALAPAGTFTIAYPDGLDEGAFYGAQGHIIVAPAAGTYRAPANFTITLGASNITVASVDMTLPAGTKLYIELAQLGQGSRLWPKMNKATKFGNRIVRGTVLEINLGAPDTIDDNGICESQNRTGAGALLINGALASGGVATLDVPRNVIADSGGADTAVITVTGTDEYGAVVKENIALNGTTAVAGKKAFKTITAVTSDDTISNGFFLGTGDVLGLPVFLPGKAYVTRELENGVAASAGTVEAGVTTKPSATTGDVRGTYDPSSACDGDKVFQLFVMVPDPDYLGLTQFAG